MVSQEIPYSTEEYKNDYSFIDLFQRVKDGIRSNWKDLHDKQGVYVIYFDKINTPIDFTDKNYKANLKNKACVSLLENKWEFINSNNKTDIIYIGKGKSLRTRIRQLIRFGHGKKNRHFGGEWLWQITNLNNLRLLISSCPKNKEKGYERYLLERFKSDHCDWPLCNRKGGENVPFWIPNNQVILK